MPVTFNGVPGFATPGAFVPGDPLVATALPVLAGTAPTIPTSGGDRSYTIRVFREIRPGDVPTSGAQLPKLTGRAFTMPVAADVEHAHRGAWEDEPPPEPAAPPGPGLLDELARAGREAAEVIDRAAELAKPRVKELGSKAYDFGKIISAHPYPPARKCGAIRKVGGTTLRCGRQPDHPGQHSDKGLHWR